MPFPNGTTALFGCFNTQPPEGGWIRFNVNNRRYRCFNTQPPEGGWMPSVATDSPSYVSTHSRPKAAGIRIPLRTDSIRSFNTQPPEGGWSSTKSIAIFSDEFQHTAARRRLGYAIADFQGVFAVSTHSRPKAAGQYHNVLTSPYSCFNTQPPEGGWLLARCFGFQTRGVSTHSRPKAAGFLVWSNITP